MRLRAVEFAGDKPAIPAQDSVRPGYAGDVGENLAAQAMTDLAERASLGVRELQAAIQLRLHDAVFRRPNIRSAPAAPGLPSLSRRPASAPNPKLSKALARIDALTLRRIASASTCSTGLAVVRRERRRAVGKVQREICLGRESKEVVVPRTSRWCTDCYFAWLC